MVNGVVFFAVSALQHRHLVGLISQVGQTAIEAYLTAFQTKDFDPLPIVASAFVSVDLCVVRLSLTCVADRRTILRIVYPPASGDPTVFRDLPLWRESTPFLSAGPDKMLTIYSCQR